MNKEDIKILEDKDCMWNYPENRILEAIQNLIKEYKRVKTGRDWLWEHRVAELATPEMLHKILRLDYVPKSKIKKEILEVMKREYNKAIEKCIETDIIERTKAGAVAQELDYFIGKIEELLNNKEFDVLLGDD